MRSLYVTVQSVSFKVHGTFTAWKQRGDSMLDIEDYFHPCSCGALGEDHYHITLHDIVPWTEFRRSFEEYRVDKLADQIQQAIEKDLPAGASWYFSGHQISVGVQDGVTVENIEPAVENVVQEVAMRWVPWNEK
jgi:hypothetical protein